MPNNTDPDFILMSRKVFDDLCHLASEYSPLCTDIIDDVRLLNVAYNQEWVEKDAQAAEEAKRRQLLEVGAQIFVQDHQREIVYVRNGRRFLPVRVLGTFYEKVEVLQRDGSETPVALADLILAKDLPPDLLPAEYDLSGDVAVPKTGPWAILKLPVAKN